MKRKCILQDRITLYRYLQGGFKHILPIASVQVYEKMQQDPEFAHGLGIYVGQVLAYLSNELQKDVLQLDYSRNISNTSLPIFNISKEDCKSLLYRHSQSALTLIP
jgi:hypothetical protein